MTSKVFLSFLSVVIKAEDKESEQQIDHDQFDTVGVTAGGFQSCSGCGLAGRCCCLGGCC